MASIEFQVTAPRRGDLRCPLCAAMDAAHTLTIDPVPITAGKLELFGCRVCQSYFYGGADPVIGYDHDGFEPKYWMHYAQIGAGMSAMLTPLFALGERARGSLLDVGCGFGFVADFWGRSGRGPAVGLESAVYGKIGAERLGVEIHPQYYNQCAAIAGRKFDLVFSSEVFEHVPDPKAFVAEIAQGLADDGILVLTTPSASIVRADADPSTLRAALSAGYHFFLASKSALTATLNAAGFAYVVVHDGGHQLIAWASRQPFPAPSLSRFEWEPYLDYLEHLSRNVDPSIQGGALYRLLRDCHNSGRSPRAAVAFERLSTLAKDVYGIDLRNPDTAAILRSPEFMTRLDRSPAWLGCALLFGGLHLGTAAGARRDRVRMFDAAVRIFRHDIATTPAYTQEPSHLLPLAEQHYRIGLADALRGELASGLGRGPVAGEKPLNGRMINEFVAAISRLTGAVVNASPTALSSVAGGTVERWRRSIAKRAKARS